MRRSMCAFVVMEKRGGVNLTLKLFVTKRKEIRYLGKKRFQKLWELSKIEIPRKFFYCRSLSHLLICLIVLPCFLRQKRDFLF